MGMFGLFKNKNKANTRSKTPETIDISSKGVEMEEIFSTKEKKVRLTNTDPLSVPKHPKNRKQTQSGSSAPASEPSITNTTTVTSIIRALDSAFDKLDTTSDVADDDFDTTGSIQDIFRGTESTADNRADEPADVSEPYYEEVRFDSDYKADNNVEREQKLDIDEDNGEDDDDDDDDFENEQDASYSRLHITGQLEREDLGKSVLATGKIIKGEAQTVNYNANMPQVSALPNITIGDTSEILGNTSDDIVLPDISQKAAEYAGLHMSSTGIEPDTREFVKKNTADNFSSAESFDAGYSEKPDDNVIYSRSPNYVPDEDDEFFSRRRNHHFEDDDLSSENQEYRDDSDFNTDEVEIFRNNEDFRSMDSDTYRDDSDFNTDEVEIFRNNEDFHSMDSGMYRDDADFNTDEVDIFRNNQDFRSIDSDMYRNDADFETDEVDIYRNNENLQSENTEIYRDDGSINKDNGNSMTGGNSGDGYEPQQDELSLSQAVFNQPDVRFNYINNATDESTENYPEANVRAADRTGDTIADQLAHSGHKYAQIYENLYSKLNQAPTESRYEKFFGAPKPASHDTSPETVAENTRLQKAERDITDNPEKPPEKFKIPDYKHESVQDYIPVIQMSNKMSSILRDAYLAYSEKKDDEPKKESKWESSVYEFDPPQKFTITISSKKMRELKKKREEQPDEIDGLDDGSIIASPFKTVDDSEPEAPDIPEVTDTPKFSNLPKDESGRKKKFSLFGSEEDENSNDDPESMDKPLGMLDDFDDVDDYKTVIDEININIHKLVLKTTLTLIITVFLIAVAFIQRFIPDAVMSVLSKAPLMYAFINFIGLGAAMFICGSTVTNGISSILAFKGNSDTVIAFTSIVGIIQCVTSLFAADKFYKSEINLYTPIIVFALLLNCIGKLLMMLRIRRNFKFVASKDEKYAAKIYNDEKKAQRLMSGVPVNKPVIAFQRKTGFLKNFLKLSYTPDPSEEMAGKIAPFAIVGSIAVAAAYGFIARSVIGALSAMTVISVVFTPAASLIAINFLISKLCKRALSSDGMLVGYPAVRQFSDCNAIMIDAKELYPKGSIILNGIKTFNHQRIDDAILACAALFNKVDNTMAGVFDNMVKANISVITNVESVAYEDGDGLVGWVNGDRVLVGSRHLLELHGIAAPDIEYEEKFRAGDRQITYVAISGDLVAMFISTYKVDPVIAAALQRMEYNGMNFLITTVDHNITAEKISDDFGVFYRTVKILPHEVSDYCKNAKSKYEEKSRSYVATTGGLASLGRVLSGCIAIKSRLSMSVIIQIIAIILGVLTVSVLVLYSGLKYLGTVEILVYMMFWSLAAIFAPQIYVDY